MRLTVFYRLISSYLAILMLVIPVTIYAIYQLRRFNSVTEHILDIDNRILEYEKKLADSHLSQLRYQRKYVITGDMTIYNQFLSAQGEFDRDLRAVTVIADTPKKRRSIERLSTYHERYRKLADGEIAYVRKNKPYPKERYEQEEKKNSEALLEELERLDLYSRKDIGSRMKMAGEAGDSARSIAIGMSAVAVSLVIITSLLITRSVTKPLSLLMHKTREISEGIFKDDLNIPSPPEIRRLAMAFNSMCSKLKSLDTMKSDFFATMSHELRTPLTSIREGTSLLLDGVGGTVTEKQKRLLTILSEESNRLISLVNSLLDLSKMEAGMMTYTIEQVNLKPLIDQATKEIAPLVEAKRIHLEAVVDEGMPTVKIDCERILQVLRNLIGNAVKFTPEGGKVRILARPADSGVEVSVEDTGPGISLSDMNTIFDKFRQSSSTGVYGAGGTGLGLAIVKHIVTSHGGKIWAKSAAGQGSTFLFVLPA